MQLVEQAIIDRRDPRYAAIDEAAFKSKNLYNAALYKMRQAFIHEGRRISYTALDKRMQPHEAYRALPAKVAQQVLKQLDQAWTSYFEAYEEYKIHPEKFRALPRLPKYKDKSKGRNLLVYTVQASREDKPYTSPEAKEPCNVGSSLPRCYPLRSKHDKTPGASIKCASSLAQVTTWSR